MTVQKGIKKRIEKEMGGCGSQPGIGEANKRDCERCGKPGHSSRTCEEEEDVIYVHNSG
jgi:hypothetical protein